MFANLIQRGACIAILIANVSACTDNDTPSTGVRQTGFPGQITAGGGTSGDALARAGRAVEGMYKGGTPGIAGGAGGNTGGTATGGTVQESGRGPSGAAAPQSGTPPASRP